MVLTGRPGAAQVVLPPPTRWRLSSRCSRVWAYQTLTVVLSGSQDNRTHSCARTYEAMDLQIWPKLILAISDEECIYQHIASMRRCTPVLSGGGKMTKVNGAVWTSRDPSMTFGQEKNVPYWLLMPLLDFATRSLETLTTRTLSVGVTPRVKE